MDPEDVDVDFGGFVRDGELVDEAGLGGVAGEIGTDSEDGVVGVISSEMCVCVCEGEGCGLPEQG